MRRVYSVSMRGGELVDPECLFYVTEQVLTRWAKASPWPMARLYPQYAFRTGDDGRGVCLGVVLAEE